MDISSFKFYEGFLQTPKTATLTISNAGDADLNWSASTPITTGGSWLQLPATSGTIHPNTQPAKLTVTVNPAGLAVGTYSSTFTISAAPNLSQTFSVTLVISPALVVTFTAGPLPDAVIDSSQTMPVSIDIVKFDGKSLQPADIAWSLQPTVPWIGLSATSGRGSALLTATFLASHGDGSLIAQLILTSPNGEFPRQSVTSEILFRTPAPFAAPSSMSVTLPPGAQPYCQPATFYATYHAQQNGYNAIWLPPDVGGNTFGIFTNDGQPWLSMTVRTSGNLAMIYLYPTQVCFDPSGLKPGVFHGSIQWSIYQRGTMTINATLTVADQPVAQASPAAVTFVAAQGVDAAPQSVTVSNAGGGTLNWTTTTSANPWWTYTPSVGTGNSSTLTIQPHTASLAVGSHPGSIFISSGSGKPIEVPLSMFVLNEARISLDKPNVSFATALGTSPPAQTLSIQNSGAAWSATVSPASAKWLTVSPATGVAPSPLNLSANTASLTAGIYNASIVITSANFGNSPLTVPVTLAVGMPTATPAGFVNGASFTPDVSPGSIVSLFGVDLSGGTAQASGSLPMMLSGTQVLVNGKDAPLFYVSPTQVNFQMPFDASGAVTTTVQSGQLMSAPVQVPVVAVSPGIFLGIGTQAAALNADYSANVPANPAAAGGAIQLFVTGLGATNPPLTTGQAGASMAPLNDTVVRPTVTIGGVNAPVLFSGAAPGFVGLYQVNVTIPAGTPANAAVPVVLTAAGKSSNTATITVK